MSVQAISWVIEHSKSKLASRLVLLAIANHANPQGENSWPSIYTIAREANISERQTQRAIRNLCALGEIRMVTIGGGRRKTNTFVLEAMSRPHCWYCGCPLYSWTITNDHQIPKSRGGREGANLVPCCRTCNQEKGDMDVEEYRAIKAGIRFAGESETVTFSLFDSKKGDILAEDKDILSQNKSELSPEPSFNRPIQRKREAKPTAHLSPYEEKELRGNFLAEMRKVAGARR